MNPLVSSFFLRKSDWQAAVNEFNKAALTQSSSQRYLEEKKKLVPRTEAMIHVSIRILLLLPAANC